MSDDFRFPAEPYHDFTAEPAPRAGNERDVFVTVVASIELAFALMRLGMVALGVAMLSAIPPDNPIRQTSPFEIGTGFLLGVTGLIAAVLLLLKMRAGVFVGWIVVFVTVLNLAVSLWQTSIILQQFEADQAQYIGGLVGGGFTVLIRLAINAVYVFALLRASKVYR